MRHSPRKNFDTISNFIEKTYRILEHQEYNQTIDWTPLGTSFVIKDIKKFEEVVLPIHFKHSNFSSFVRQLNMYNFHKVRGDRHDCEFEHDKFRKGRREILCKIKRKQSEALILSNITIQQPALYFQSFSDQSNQGKKISELGMSDINFNQNPQIQASKLEQLRQLNKSLKQMKQLKLQKQKTLASVNPQDMGEKFFKLITSLVADKIRRELGIQNKISNHDISQDSKNASFDALIEHIIGNSNPQSFSSYSETANSISQKQNCYDFMIKKSLE